jgi:hypothetical protein
VQREVDERVGSTTGQHLMIQQLADPREDRREKAADHGLHERWDSGQIVGVGTQGWWSTVDHNRLLWVTIGFSTRIMPQIGGCSCVRIILQSSPEGD